jgi:hypothetical protein
MTGQLLQVAVTGHIRQENYVKTDMTESAGTGLPRKDRNDWVAIVRLPVQPGQDCMTGQTCQDTQDREGITGKPCQNSYDQTVITEQLSYYSHPKSHSKTAHRIGQQ